MHFNLDGSRGPREVPKSQIDSEQLVKPEETAENFDDCVQDKAGENLGGNYGAAKLEEAEDDFEDCEAKLDEMEEELSEFSDDEDDYFNDCGKETDDTYVVKVTYVSDGKISEKESHEEIQEACKECGDPEDVVRFEANTNEHITVVNAEVIERPDPVEPELAEVEHEEAVQTYEEAREQLEERQERAGEYQTKLQNEIQEEHEQSEVEGSAQDIAPEVSDKGTETENVEDKELKAAEEASRTDEEVEVKERETSEEDTEGKEKIEDNESEAAEKNIEPTEGNFQKTEQEAVNENLNPVKDNPNETNPDASNEDLEPTEDNSKGAEQENIGEDLKPSEDMEHLSSEEAEVKDADVCEASEKVEENAKAGTRAELLPERHEEVEKDRKNRIESPAEDRGIQGNELQKAVEEETEKPTGEQTEHVGQDRKRASEELENTEDSPALDQRIGSAFERDNATSAEFRDLSEEYAELIEQSEAEREKADTEASAKFEAVMSKERGTDEYKQALQEYNDARVRKEQLDEETASLHETQDRLEKKSLELRNAQIEKGRETVSASAQAVENAVALESKYNGEYYINAPSEKSLSELWGDNQDVLRKLSDSKRSLRLAMDAKMEEVSDYVRSNNLDRYETANDPYYRQLTQEYLSFKSAYDTVGYHIAKLDENSRLLSQRLGLEYTPALEQRPQPAIREVADGLDRPGETEYFVDEERASKVLSRFEPSKWESLTLREQKQAVENLADYNADILGIGEKPRIVYYNKEDSGDFGGFSEEQNVIYINEYNLGDSAEIADTISHEYRHKYQHERAEKMENERDLAFKDSFDNYVSPEDDYQAYLNQPVEADAREYAARFKERMDMSSERETLEESGEARASELPGRANQSPEKGTVFKEPAPSALPVDLERKRLEPRHFKEQRQPTEILTPEELAEFTEVVRPAYDNGARVATKLDGFATYKEHRILEGGHIERVRIKSLEAADVLSKHFEQDDYGGLYSPQIDRKTLEVMALYHDTGMDGNLDPDETPEDSSAKPVREAHPLQSAIHVLRDRHKLEANQINADEVALGCLLHSKSNSGVGNLSDEGQWKEALSRLQNGVDAYNSSHPDEPIRFDPSFVWDEQKGFDRSALAQLRSESLALRIGDANGHDSMSRVSQSGADIAFDLNDWDAGRPDLPEDLVSKIVFADESALMAEVQHAKVCINGERLTDETDEEGMARAYAVGEGNFKEMSFGMRGQRPCEKITLENGNAYPLSTQFCIEERIREINTAKLEANIVPDRLLCMTDKQYRDYCMAAANRTRKIDCDIVLSMKDVAPETRRSYEAFAAKMLQKYSIQVVIDA